MTMTTVRAFHAWWALAMAVFIIITWVPDILRYKAAKRQEAEYQARLDAWQADDYFVVRSVEVANSVVGEPIFMVVDRDIKQVFTGSYATAVRQFPGGSLVCEASASFLTYDPERQLPEPLTLSWWADNGDCSTDDLPVGEYFVDTKWTIHPQEPDLPDREIKIRSNPFTVTAVSQEDARQAIEKQQTVVDELETLRRQLKELQDEVHK